MWIKTARRTCRQTLSCVKAGAQGWRGAPCHPCQSLLYGVFQSRPLSSPHPTLTSAAQPGREVLWGGGDKAGQGGVSPPTTPRTTSSSTPALSSSSAAPLALPQHQLLLWGGPIWARARSWWSGPTPRLAGCLTWSPSPWRTTRALRCYWRGGWW